MTADDRNAISKALDRIDEEDRRNKAEDWQSVRYWLERLDDGARETVREFFDEIVVDPNHARWDLAVEVLGWLGWPEPARNAEMLARSLTIVGEASYLSSSRNCCGFGMR